MSIDEFQVRCETCGTVYDFNQLICQVILTFSFPHIDNEMFRVPFQCSQCQHQVYAQLTDAQYTIFSDVLNKREIKAMVTQIYESKRHEDALYTPSSEVSYNHEINSMEAQIYEPEPDEGDYHQPTGDPYDFYESPEALIQSESPPPTEKKPNKILEFQTLIKTIDKNLDTINLFAQIRDAFATIADEASSDIAACCKLAKDELGLTSRDIEAFKKGLNGIKAQKEIEKKRMEYNDIINRHNTPPQELTEQEKQEALAYLSDIYLIQNISRDIGIVGEIVGEETNKMMLYLAAISRKFKKPISLVIFGKSSSGKSFLANAIEKFVPPEDKLILSSSSTRALEYSGDFLKHKFLLVQEWEGMEEILPTIRTLQSEGKLSRLVTIKNPDDNTYKSVATSQECPCCVVVTTTREGIHDENSTRIFELYADESVAQTQHVVSETIRKANIKNRQSENVREKILTLHHNIQRILEPIDVDIPFAEHMTFPTRTTRNRRDSERFIQLIKTVAFLRQKQKPIKNHDGVNYIEADIFDYEVAYYYGIPVLSATLDQISERAKNALRVCCALMDDFKQKGQLGWFTVNQIQQKAPSLGLDFGNRQDLYKQLAALTEYEYLDINQPKPKGTKFYTVIFSYVRNEAGAIINIGTREVKEIITPDMLMQKINNSPQLQQKN